MLQVSTTRYDNLGCRKKLERGKMVRRLIHTARQTSRHTDIQTYSQTDELGHWRGMYAYIAHSFGNTRSCMSLFSIGKTKMLPADVSNNQNMFFSWDVQRTLLAWCTIFLEDAPCIITKIVLRRFSTTRFLQHIPIIATRTCQLRFVRSAIYSSSWLFI